MNHNTPDNTTQMVEPQPPQIPWYRGLWWTIWLTIFAAIVTYGAGTALYFRFIIAPAIQAEKKALLDEKEKYIVDFRTYIQEQTASYHQELKDWRLNTPVGTEPPTFNYRERAKLFRDKQERQGHEELQNTNPINTWVWLSLMIFTMGLATYPVARRITRRLENLQKGVEDFGTGNLQTRVHVKGGDEVALLAKSFNASAQQVEGLMLKHKELLAYVSHELRTPLARLRMSTELASQKVPEIALDLRTDIKELDELVGEILLASRLDAAIDILRPSSFDAFALAAEEAARTDAELMGNSVEIYADEALIRRAVRNLLTNAQRYAPDTEVTITVSKQEATPQQAEMVCFAVADHGCGVLTEEKVKIFDPFFKSTNAQNVAGSTGLGLSLVKQIAEKHKGAVACLDQEKDCGCIFELKIPIAFMGGK